MINGQELSVHTTIVNTFMQGLSQDLETGRPKLGALKVLGVQILKRDHIILRFQP